VEKTLFSKQCRTLALNFKPSHQPHSVQLFSLTYETREHGNNENVFRWQALSISCLCPLKQEETDVGKTWEGNLTCKGVRRGNIWQSAKSKPCYHKQTSAPARCLTRMCSSCLVVSWASLVTDSLSGGRCHLHLGVRHQNLTLYFTIRATWR